MASLHAATGGTSSGSASSSDARYTPVSNESEEENTQRRVKRQSVGPLKLQTDFGDFERDIQDDRVPDEGDKGFDSDDQLQRTPSRLGYSKQFTAVEEAQVVDRFDRRLVPFLALLYLLSFLDRSSK